MAFVQCSFYSEVLGMTSQMNVFIPQQTSTQIGLEGSGGKKKYPVLYLLHGLTDDHSIWSRRTSIERYVAPLPLVVVMPNVDRSFYSDMHRGGNYWTFISEELPQIVKSFFPVSDKREDTFVAGLSMGGYGAFKLALRKPENFAAAASLSGVMDVCYFAGNYRTTPEFQAEMENVFGPLPKLSGSENDLFSIAEKLLASGKKIPELFQICGTEDFLYESNIIFRDFAAREGLPLTYEEAPGAHGWAFWDKHIQRVLEWLPLLLRNKK